MACPSYLKIWARFVLFAGEAEVHASQARAEGQQQLVPNKAGLQLWKAWLYWRFVNRRAQYRVEYNMSTPSA